MSIIEKAVERLERPRKAPPPVIRDEVRPTPEEIEARVEELEDVAADASYAQPVPAATPVAREPVATRPEAVPREAPVPEPAPAPARVPDAPVVTRASPPEAPETKAPAATGPAVADPPTAPVSVNGSALPVADGGDGPIVGDVSGIVEVDGVPDIASTEADAAAGHTSKTIALDFERLRALGIITPDSTESPIAEEHRLIKRPLLMNASLDGNHRIPRGNMILVTSSLPGEGKTFTSINMAISTAMEHDRTVLLVDTDVYKADVGNILGISDEEEGLTDYLKSPKRDLSEFLVKTDMPKLTVLPCGVRQANVTELFASESMRRLVDELSTRYQDRIVIFDSPPLLATSGAGVLAALVGQVVLVVESVRTSRAAIRESLHMLDHIDYVGVVVNKSRERRRGGYSYGKYGYGYGYGHRA